MKKVIIIAILVIGIMVGIGITYSLYISEANTDTDISLAAFIVNAEKKDLINIPISNMKPGDSFEYTFSISNNSQAKRSDVNIEYNIVIKTMHLMPLDIELYDSEDHLVLTCDEEAERNDDNELECSTENTEMPYVRNVEDDYTIKISFPVEYNTMEYASLVDYINLEIKSNQKTE